MCAPFTLMNTLECLMTPFKISPRTWQRTEEVQIWQSLTFELLQKHQLAVAWRK